MLCITFFDFYNAHHLTSFEISVNIIINDKRYDEYEKAETLKSIA